MIVQCAWCLKMVGEKAPLRDKAVTHGICEECQQKMMKKVEEMSDNRNKYIV